MNKLLYIGRLVMAVGLLLLLAVAPAMAQNVVYVGETIPLAVEQKGLDNYQWHLYSDSTVNFAVAPADVNPAYAEFIGASDTSEVNVLWKIPGTYFFKVTAVDENNCAMNLKIGRMTVKNNPKPILDALAINSKCTGEKGRIFFTVTNVAPGNYTVKHNHGGFNVTVVADTFSVEAPAGRYDNLTIHVNGYSSYDASNPVNVEVKQPAPFVIYPTVTPINLMTNVNGSIMLRVQGGNGGYTYLWSNGATTKDISDLKAGDYSVTITDKEGCSKIEKFTIPEPKHPPVAVNDIIDWKCNFSIDVNLLTNDMGEVLADLYIDIDPFERPKNGSVQLNSDGTFVYRPNPSFTGKDQFTYTLYDKSRYPGITATVTINVPADFDYDGIPDDVDPDADGDGILNIDEAMPGQDWHTADFDRDGLPNYLDIDSDGDGIVDNVEAQGSQEYRKPLIFDANSNGINDAYEGLQSGYEIKLVDSDEDGVPDYLDLDSDNDSVKDYIEGHDKNKDGRPDHRPLWEDADGDGLDDAYDWVPNICGAEWNALGSNAAMQDTEDDGKPDWRDDNDDGDDYPTRLEDLDGDGDYSNDNFDYDIYPEYLDYGRDCDLFIPNAFSPNKDGVYDKNGVHDTFMIYCLNHYPNAKIYIFDQSGNKLFEKANYGREDLFGDQAWWDGKADRGRNKGELLPPGTYFYVLDLGNGEVKKSFVFLSY